MTKKTIPADDIRKHAEQAAKDGKGPEACPYKFGSDDAHYWRDCFYPAVSQVMKIREAA